MVKLVIVTFFPKGKGNEGSISTQRTSRQGQGEDHAFLARAEIRRRLAISPAGTRKPRDRTPRPITFFPAENLRSCWQRRSPPHAGATAPPWDKRLSPYFGLI